MDFIISLAHFCEVHGPTSILCTQAQTSPCDICLPHRPTRANTSAPTPPQSSHGANTPSIVRHTPASSPLQLASPTETPPSSPRSPLLSSSSLGPLPSSGSQSDTCRSCAITYPKTLSASLAASGNKKPPLRSDIPVLVSGPNPHTHNLNCVSTRAPTIPARYANLRQSCVRTLSCELVPAQTGPIMFGDPLTGYTIAFVFRLSDPLARGNKRTYALLCLSPQQSPLIAQWPLITRMFEKIVHDITVAAEKAAAENKSANSSPSPNASVSSRGPDGFLRRTQNSHVAQGLADLCNNEELFVQLHANFCCLLRRLTVIYGSVPVLDAEAMMRSTASSVDGRSRAGSVSSDDYTVRK